MVYKHQLSSGRLAVLGAALAVGIEFLVMRTCACSPSASTPNWRSRAWRPQPVPPGTLKELPTGIGAAIDAVGGSFTMSYAAVAVTRRALSDASCADLIKQGLRPARLRRA